MYSCCYNDRGAFSGCHLHHEPAAATQTPLPAARLNPRSEHNQNPQKTSTILGENLQKTPMPASASFSASTKPASTAAVAPTNALPTPIKTIPGAFFSSGMPAMNSSSPRPPSSAETPYLSPVISRPTAASPSTAAPMTPPPSSPSPPPSSPSPQPSS